MGNPYQNDYKIKLFRFKMKHDKDKLNNMIVFVECIFEGEIWLVFYYIASKIQDGRHMCFLVKQLVL